ncbi:hypothetical protein B0T26DRAFT_303057 [Lasiosphaeria miniovina]|uniref:Uncharacterized protein n=1 Tax=Lasiosphaeria miniovina TaxID=1954250 RepID=A0AA40DW26_9PEZI|nr:uncharacterized protein B0T26DRAFT_303057 [Lasiosphaeria miniovina]KAK0717740.1 hypothetical protein B0T26DRAFT_303057 [Lasiosphaeria miniovina]
MNSQMTAHQSPAVIVVNQNTTTHKLDGGSRLIPHVPSLCRCSQLASRGRFRRQLSYLRPQEPRVTNHIGLQVRQWWLNPRDRNHLQASQPACLSASLPACLPACLPVCLPA